MTTLFISDLHLCATAPDITRQFLDFIRGEARRAEHLYILGDLFEFWIGDDDPDPVYQEIQAGLRELTAAGVPVSVMHGNRDFLLGRRFAARTGCRLIADGTTIELDGQRLWLAHGDVLCTDDHAYQRLRRIVRNPLIQWLFGLLPLRKRVALANRIRSGSREHTQQSASHIMDVNEQAVNQAFARSQTRLMIHGHTHRPHIHTHALQDGQGTRIVLGDWYTQGSVLRWSEGSYQLLTLPRAG